LLIRSRYGLIHLDTPEEDRAGVLLRHVADLATFKAWLAKRKAVVKDSERGPSGP
jgi:hypothetical protein